MQRVALDPPVEFVPAQLPDTVSMKPGAYELVSLEPVSPQSGSASAASSTAEKESDADDSNDNDNRRLDSQLRSSESESDRSEDKHAFPAANNFGVASNEPSASSDESSETEDSGSESANNVGKRQTSLEPLPASAFYDIGENPRETGRRSDRVFKSWTPSARAPVGLENRGVTCYINAAIQTLFHLPAVGRYLLDVAKNRHPEIKPNSVTVELCHLFKKVTETRKPKVYPARIIRRLEDINFQMSEFQQEDSHEFYMSLLSRLQEDSVPRGQKLRSSILHDMFGGTIEQKVRCETCGHVSTTQQDFCDLPVSFASSQRNSSYTLERSIYNFFRPEAIRVGGSPGSAEGYQCEKCKTVTQATKHNRIIDAPEYLTIHIKRFKFKGSVSQKVKEPMSYPMDLDLTRYTINFEPLRYRLMAIICHEGRTVSSGHYIAICRQNGVNKWAEYDDDIVRDVSEEEVKNQESAYILVYSRLALKNSRAVKEAARRVKEQCSTITKKPLPSKFKHKNPKTTQSHSRAARAARIAAAAAAAAAAASTAQSKKKGKPQFGKVKRSALDEIDAIFKRQKL